jgi:hypothetical protein
MPRRKKVIEERAVRPLDGIRLVKANDVASREAAPAPTALAAAEAPGAKVVEFQVRPELRRKPRDAREARNMFDDLFRAA